MSADLDRLVAEKVMGWTADAGVYLCRRQWHPEDVPLCVAVDRWKPSTEMAYAWGVVEEIGDRYGTMIDGPFALSLHDHNGTWFASFGGFHSPESETAPLAICRAALLAVGVPCP